MNPFRDGEGNVKRIYDETKLLEYKHSSLPDYFCENRALGKILAPQKFPEYFETVANHKRELVSWLDFDENMM